MPDSIPIGLQLNREFYERPTLTVARDLLGMRLVRLDQGRRLSGIIVETEAYRGEEDQGCHCRAGLTPRTRVMYGPAGHAYVYFTYGMHWMLNFVTEPGGFPAAVLIRAVNMDEGLDLISARRNGQPPQHWTDGPAKLTQALNIDHILNGADLCGPEAELFVTMGRPLPDSAVSIGPRVGLNTVPEPWKSIPWRFVIRESRMENGEYSIENRDSYLKRLSTIESRLSNLYSRISTHSFWRILWAYLTERMR